MSDWANNFELNTLAKLYHVVDVSDGMGGVTQTVSKYATVNCAFWQMGSNEQLYGDRIHNPSTHKMFLKPRSDILSSDLIIINNITYRIDRPDDILGNEEAMTIGLSQEG